MVHVLSVPLKNTNPTPQTDPSTLQTWTNASIPELHLPNCASPEFRFGITQPMSCSTFSTMRFCLLRR